MSTRSLVLALSAVAVIAVVGWLAFHSAAGGATVPGSIVGEPAARPQPQAAPASARPAGADAPPSVRPDANANVASVAEAARTGKHPERLTPLMAPKPFDAAAFRANPQAYLDVVEPGRVFQSAAPGPAVPVLRSKGTASFEIPRGGTCPLMVITAPNAPVTFTALDLGTFPNQLTSITVVADAQGVAATTFAATGGVIADAAVLAGSPLASGQVKFQVFVTERPVAAAGAGAGK
jgi:hypothetical protein